MKTKFVPACCRCRFEPRGFLQIDLVVALAILTVGVVPLGYSFARERQMLKAEYCRSVANEIVDGEMEILAAGAGKVLPDGSQIYNIHAKAATSLPPGRFQLTKNSNRLRLEWNATKKSGIGPVVRETLLK